MQRANALERGIAVTQKLIDQIEIPGGIESIQQNSRQAMLDKYPHRILSTPISRVSLLRESVLDQARVLDEEIPPVLKQAYRILEKKEFAFLEILLQMEDADEDKSKPLSSDVPSAMPKFVQEPLVLPKISSLERRYPQVRQTIGLYLDQITENNIAGPINGSQLTKFFTRIKATDTARAIEKGIITPETGRDNHPAYKTKEIAILLYIKNQGNSLTPRMVKDLQEIVDEEILKRKRLPDSDKA